MGLGYGVVGIPSNVGLERVAATFLLGLGGPMTLESLQHTCTDMNHQTLDIVSINHSLQSQNSV